MVAHAIVDQPCQAEHDGRLVGLDVKSEIWKKAVPSEKDINERRRKQHLARPRIKIDRYVEVHDRVRNLFHLEESHGKKQCHFTAKQKIKFE